MKALNPLAEYLSAGNQETRVIQQTIGRAYSKLTGLFYLESIYNAVAWGKHLEMAYTSQETKLNHVGRMPTTL